MTRITGTEEETMYWQGQLPTGDKTIGMVFAAAVAAGVPRPLLEATALAMRKAKDYNGRAVSRDAYFPLGLASYAQMINVKALRLISLSSQQGKPNFESARDTLLDLINYVTFAVEWLDKQED